MHPHPATEPPLPTQLPQLIPVGTSTIGGETVRTVSGRRVHAYLGARRDYSSWMKDRVEKFGFTEGVDYITYEDLSSPNSGSAKARAQVTVEHALTLDMGKELGMVDRSERGREIRRYFLDCERKLDGRLAPDLSDPSVLLRLLTEQAQGRIEDRRRAAEAEAVAAVAQGSLDRLGGTKGAVPLRDAGKTLGFVKCDDIFDELEAMAWIYRREPKGRWIAHADKQRAGYLDHRPHTYTDRSGQSQTVSQVVVTPKGLVKLAELFTKTLFH